MSKTMKFNVTVNLGGKSSYAPGKAVPIGSKGLSEEEAQNLIENFGVWTPAEGADADSSELKADLDTSKRTAERVPGLEAEITRLTANVTRLETELAARPSPDALAAGTRRVDELEADNATLAAEVEKLTREASVSAIRIEELEADNATLAAEVEKLTDAAGASAGRIEQLESELEKAKSKASSK